jgi:hypothetical protein
MNHPDKLDLALKPDAAFNTIAEQAVDWSPDLRRFLEGSEPSRKTAL